MAFSAHMGEKEARGVARSVLTAQMDSADDLSASPLDSLDVQVQVLPNKLRIGRVPKGGLAAAAFPLLNLVLFPAEGSVTI